MISDEIHWRDLPPRVGSHLEPAALLSLNRRRRVPTRSRRSIDGRTSHEGTYPHKDSFPRTSVAVVKSALTPIMQEPTRLPIARHLDLPACSGCSHIEKRPLPGLEQFPLGLAGGALQGLR